MTRRSRRTVDYGHLTTAMILLLGGVSIAHPSDRAFVESFSGRPGGYEAAGAYPLGDGFDNPGWSLRSDGALRFEDGGLLFAHQGVRADELVGQSSSLSKSLGELGSFAQATVIRNLDLGTVQDGEHQDAGSALVFGHEIGLAGMSMQIIPHRDLNTWDLSLVVSGPRNEGHLVPKGNNVALEMFFDADASEVQFAYDNNVDDDVPALRFGPLEFEPRGDNTHATNLRTGASGGENRVANGLLDAWSVTELIIPGDYDDDHLLTVADVDLLLTRVREGPFGESYVSVR